MLKFWGFNHVVPLGLFYTSGRLQSPGSVSLHLGLFTFAIASARTSLRDFVLRSAALPLAVLRNAIDSRLSSPRWGFVVCWHASSGGAFRACRGGAERGYGREIAPARFRRGCNRPFASWGSGGLSEVLGCWVNIGFVGHGERN